jgi:hypothetical protein
MCRLASHEALCLAIAVEKLTDHQFPQGHAVPAMAVTCRP